LARAPAANSPEVQCLHEAHKVVEAHVGVVCAPDSSEENVGLHACGRRYDKVRPRETPVPTPPADASTHLTQLSRDMPT